MRTSIAVATAEHLQIIFMLVKTCKEAGSLLQTGTSPEASVAIQALLEGLRGLLI